MNINKTRNVNNHSTLLTCKYPDFENVVSLLGTAASDNPKPCLENVDTTNQSKQSGLKKKMDTPSQ